MRDRLKPATVALVTAASLLACSNADPPDADRPDAAPSDPAPTVPGPGDTSGTDAPTTTPADAGHDADAGADPDGVQPDGFTTVTARITAVDGEVCEVCLWLADSADERGRGLMGVTDLGDAAGMAFLFEQPTAGAFYMFQTPTPLSIAWFASDGTYVGSADMAPCLDTPAGDCPLYSPGVAYDLAIEVFEGALPGLGIAPGSTAVLVPGTESLTCLAPATSAA